MRILHINRSAHPGGGVETYLADLLAAQSRRGDSVGLLAADQATDFSVTTFQSISAEERTVQDFVERFAPDVIHIHDACLPIGVEREFRRIYPVVDSIHDFSFACASGEHYFRDGAACNRPHGRGCLVNLVLRGCAHRVDIRHPVARYRDIDRRLPLLRRTSVVVASDYMRSVAIGNGVSGDRCDVIPYFAHRPVTPPVPSLESALAYVGRVSRNKGLGTLLRALALAREPWERLLVAGDGWDLSHCRSLSLKLGLGAKVSFLGWCAGKAITDVLAKTRVVVVPSRWPEPFGIVGIEAMAQARPVIASRIGGIPEWLDEGETGLLVEPSSAESLAKALDTLLADRDRAASMGCKGWERVERFSLDSHIGRLDAVYTRALEARAGSRSHTDRFSAERPLRV